MLASCCNRLTSSPRSLLLQPHRLLKGVVKKGIPFQKSLDILKRDEMIIENTSARIQINDTSMGESYSHFSLFLYERVPAMKYHNPDIPINCTRDPGAPTSLRVDCGDGEWTDIATGGKTSQQLVDQVLELTKVAESVVDESLLSTG